MLKQFSEPSHYVERGNVTINSIDFQWTFPNALFNFVSDDDFQTSHVSPCTALLHVHLKGPWHVFSTFSGLSAVLQRRTITLYLNKSFYVFSILDTITLEFLVFFVWSNSPARVWTISTTTILKAEFKYVYEVQTFTLVMCITAKTEKKHHYNSGTLIFSRKFKRKLSQASVLFQTRLQTEIRNFSHDKEPLLWRETRKGTNSFQNPLRRRFLWP